MADDTNQEQGTGQARPLLPPLKSSVRVGGGGVAASGPAKTPTGAKASPVPKPPGQPIVRPETSTNEPASPHEADQPPSAGQGPAKTPASAPKPAPAAARKPKQDKPPENDQGIWRLNRKNFLNVAGWFAFFSFLGTATVGAIRLMVPRVLYEAPSAFKAGFPNDYIIGEVNETYRDEFRVWIVREAEGFYALSTICTHLGCTPRWLPSESKFKCPCHGSGYHKDGINFEGPTPRPLERLKITLADDGQILVDRNTKFLYEKQEWSRPGAFLKYT